MVTDPKIPILRTTKHILIKVFVLIFANLLLSLKKQKCCFKKLIKARQHNYKKKVKA